MSFLVRVSWLLLVVVLVPIVSFGLVTNWWAEQSFEKRAIQHLQSVVAQQRDRIRNTVSNNIELFALVASRTQLRLSLRSFQQTGDSDHVRKMVKILRDAQASLPQFLELTIIDDEGNVIASTRIESRNRFNLPVPDESTSFKIIRLDDESVGARLLGPLRLDGEVIGRLLIFSSANDLKSVVQQIEGLGETGETLLARADPNGKIVFLMPTRFDPNAALQRQESDSDRLLPMTRALKGIELGFSDTIDYLGNPVISATAPIPELGWGVVAKIDRAEVMAELYTTRQYAMSALILVCGFIAGAILIIWRSIKLPVQSILSGVESVGSGDLTTRIELPPGTEFAQIGSALNRMLAKLENSNETVQREALDRQRAEQRSSQIIESAPTAMILCTADGLISLVNRAAVELFGYERTELVGKPIETLVPERYASKHPDHQAAYLKSPTSRMMGAGRNLTGRRKDGSEVPIEIGLNPIQTDQGALVLSAIVDLSERREFESDLLRKNELLERDDWIKTGKTELAECMRHATDLDDLLAQITGFFCTYLDAVSGALYMAENDEWRVYAGHATQDQIAERRFKSGEGLVGQAALDGKSRLLVLPDDNLQLSVHLGAIKPKTLAVVPFCLGQETLAVLEIARLHSWSDRDQDLLEQLRESVALEISVAIKSERLEELLEESRSKSRALEQANRHKSSFLANMSHELRTPLNSVLLLARSLSNNESNHLDEDEQRAAIQIESSGENLLSLINDILDLSKIEAGKLDIKPVEFDIREFVDEIIQQFKPMAKEKLLDIECEVDTNLPDNLCTDRQRITQILVNLLGNAVKFTVKGSVTLKAQLNAGKDADADEILFSVHDTGIGIAQDQLERIFGAFNQADDGRDREFGGTGLGLSICRQLAELLGGSIQVSSLPGSGSEFQLHLPLGSITSNSTQNQSIGTTGASAPGTPPAPPKPAETYVMEPFKVLLINTDMREAYALSAVFSLHFASVQIAASANHANEILANGSTIDIVLAFSGEHDDEGLRKASKLCNSLLISPADLCVDGEDPGGLTSGPEKLVEKMKDWCRREMCQQQTKAS